VARRPGSSRWLREHHSDPFVARARAEGYRSRAAFKLAELDRRHRLLRPGARIVDLGAAPGGWSQWAAERVGAQGRVVAVDLLPVPPIPGVTVIQGDFLEPATRAAVQAALGGLPADLVLSDMAPNLSGIPTVDQARALELAESALELASDCLRPGGTLLVKLFQGEGLDAYLRLLRTRFARVELRKPDASRPRSRELYVLAREFGGV
jgi:23S rRNA (uridine2552-2'-O)-methyltransferase